MVFQLQNSAPNIQPNKQKKVNKIPSNRFAQKGFHNLIYFILTVNCDHNFENIQQHKKKIPEFYYFHFHACSSRYCLHDLAILHDARDTPANTNDPNLFKAIICVIQCNDCPPMNRIYKIILEQRVI